MIFPNKLIKKFFRKLNYIIMRVDQFNEIRRTRDFFINKYISQTKFELQNRTGVSGIVFSYDRPMQLYLFLDSLLRHSKGNTPGLKIVFRCSRDDYRAGYIYVQNNFQKKLDIDWIEQSSDFKEDVMNCLSNIATEKIFFCVDDDYFIRPVDWDLISGFKLKSFDIISLRLGEGINYSYTANRSMDAPAIMDFDGKIKYFKWFDSKYEWSDPFSLDGNIYLISTIQPLMDCITFNSPNSLESSLKELGSLFLNNFSFCFESPRLLNLVINKVQEEVNNRHPGIGKEFLLKKWLQNEIINIDVHGVNSTHCEISDPEFISLSELTRKKQNDV